MRPHLPVLLNEVLAVFEGRSICTFFDGTLGAGGHAAAILEAHPEIERYIGSDLDPQALEIAKKHLAPWKEKILFVQGSHREMKSHLKKARLPCIDGVLIDAGVSSMQLDVAEKGFSFQVDGPLDMRMDPELELTAERIVNRWREDELMRILREYGEEPRARAIARTIVAARKKNPIRTTLELVAAIRPVARGKKHLHFATLTFQALRIAVNDELGALKEGIESGIEALCPGGRIAVIAFHRLEDRISKESFRAAAKGGELLLLTKKPLVPTQTEIRSNPRSRSAKLRTGEKVVDE